MQNHKKIKVEVNDYTIEIDGNTYSITWEDVTLDGDSNDLSVSQRTWLDNIYACSTSFIGTLNLEGESGGI